MSLAQTARLFGAGAKPAPRPTRIVPERFEAFRLGDKGQYWPICEDGRPIVTDDFDACFERVLPGMGHKWLFAIRRTNLETGAVMLHLYVIRQESKPTYVYRDYQTIRTHRRRAEHVADIPGEMVRCP